MLHVVGHDLHEFFPPVGDASCPGDELDESSRARGDGVGVESDHDPANRLSVDRYVEEGLLGGSRLRAGGFGSKWGGGNHQKKQG